MVSIKIALVLSSMLLSTLSGKKVVVIPINVANIVTAYIDGTQYYHSPVVHYVSYLQSDATAVPHPALSAAMRFNTSWLFVPAVK